MKSRGANTKALEVRQQRAAAKLEKRTEEEKRKEDLRWKDDVTQAKLQKKEEQLAKQTDKLKKKAELRKLAEEENNKFSTNKESKGCETNKLTMAEIQRRALLQFALEKKKAQSAKEELSTLPLLTENPNRLLSEEKFKAEAAGQEYVSASSVSEFLRVTNGETSFDRAPERRMRAAHKAYEEEWMPRLKAQFPSLKHTQLKEKIWKMWLKAPDNPMNKQSALATDP